MRGFSWPNSRLSVLASVATLYLLISTILRFILWFSFARTAGTPLLDLPEIVVAGALNDIVAILYMLIPTSLYVTLVPDSWWGSKTHRATFLIALFAILFALIYVSVAEYFFFEEFTARFNLVAVDYLVYPQEVFINIWDSYPVVWVLAATAIVAASLTAVGLQISSKALATSTPLKNRWIALAVHLGLALLATLTISSDTFAHSHDRIERELEMNGLSTFVRAARTHDLAYTDFYSTLPRETAFADIRGILGSEGVPFASATANDLRRVHVATPGRLGHSNVVVIVEESFGSNFVGVAGSRRHYTPSFDALARRSIYFSETYASGTRTVRGLEAVTASFPPIPSESIVKREGSEHIATWGSVMRSLGYQTSFLYGGYGTFDHMNEFYRSNDFDISDRTSIEHETFGNIWGACDQDLFAHAAKYYDARAATGKPFFSIIMTTSNHKPFTFPAGIPLVPAEGGGRAAGVRYADYALGEFLRKAESHSWFDDTVFVVVADHGARVYGRTQIPMPNYHIPLLIYAPGRLGPRVVSTLTSQIDIAPTVLGLLGLPYTAPFYGRDALANDFRPHDILLSHNHDVALYRDGKIAILGLHGASGTFRIDRHSGREVELPADRELTDSAIAYYQTAFETFRDRRYR